MVQRGRKSAAQLATIRSILRASAYDRVPPTHDLSPPPDHLSPDMKAWWNAVVADYELGPHHLRALQVACECWDLSQQARASLAKHGLTYEDGKGMLRQRPEAAIVRDARVGFLRAVRDLKLDVEPPKPPRIGGLGVTWEDLQER